MIGNFRHNFLVSVFLLVSVCNPMALLAASPEINRKCGEEADRLGLSGPERWDFRARCKGSGTTFANSKLEPNCRQMVINAGRSRQLINQIKNFCKKKEYNAAVQANKNLYQIHVEDLELINSSVSKCALNEDKINEFKSLIQDRKDNLNSPCTTLQ